MLIQKNHKQVTRLLQSNNFDLVEHNFKIAGNLSKTISDIPFNGPISEVRVARIDGKLIGCLEG
jgi:polyribonucleotide nucleotidyltransferase